MRLLSAGENSVLRRQHLPQPTGTSLCNVKATSWHVGGQRKNRSSVICMLVEAKSVRSWAGLGAKATG